MGWPRSRQEGSAAPSGGQGARYTLGNTPAPCDVRKLSRPGRQQPAQSLMSWLSRRLATIETVMVILNLGCGSRTSRYCINVDWSPYLRLKRSRLGSRLAPFVLKGERRERFQALDGNVIVHDLRRGVPAPDNSADAVYHSHVLEHLDRQLVSPFLADVYRALRVGGVHRVVVPDLEARCRDYLAHLDRCTDQAEEAAAHDGYVAAIIEQMVRREAAGTTQQPPLRRFVENLLFGDARRRGETHQWMYDRVNLSVALDAVGFRDVTVVDCQTSAIPVWEKIRLDQFDDGREYIPGSLYIEAVK